MCGCWRRPVSQVASRSTMINRNGIPVKILGRCDRSTVGDTGYLDLNRRCECRGFDRKYRAIYRAQGLLGGVADKEAGYASASSGTHHDQLNTLFSCEARNYDARVTLKEMNC